jgi:hypothetical protein
MATTTKKTSKATFKKSNKGKALKGTGKENSNKKGVSGTPNAHKKDVSGTPTKRKNASNKRKQKLNGVDGVGAKTLLITSIIAVAAGVGVYFGHQAAKNSEIKKIAGMSHDGKPEAEVAKEDKEAAEKMAKEKLGKFNAYTLWRLRKLMEKMQKENLNFDQLSKKEQELLTKVGMKP